MMARIAMKGPLAWTLVWACLLVSLWLRHAFPVFALGPVMHDDALFVKLAGHICSGNWLGPYDNLTLAKGAGYPAFLCASHLAGVPLKMAEHGLYLVAAVYFAWVVGRLLDSRAVMVVLVAVLAFNPVFWAPEIGGRVIRENLYQGLSLLLLALCMHAYVTPWKGLLSPRRIGVLCALGVVGAVYWLTREEGVWLLPAIAVLAGWGLYEARRRVRNVLLLAGIPVAVFGLLVGATNAINLAYYGTFRNNDFRSHDFQSAYGALSRVSHDKWRPHVVFPEDARQRAYRVSPAASELRPYLDGNGGEMWRQTGCPRLSKAECPEIPSGWFIWALRDAAAAAGHYRSAPDASEFYRRLAAEVDAGCESGAIPCGPRRSSMVPPWRAEFVPMTWKASQEMFWTLASLGEPRVGIEPSMGTPQHLDAFRRVIHGRLARAEDVGYRGWRMRIARWIAPIQVGATAILLPSAIVAWLVLLVYSMRRRAWNRTHLVVAALFAAVAARSVLLGFLDATSIPVNRSLYPSPAVPMALVFAPCVLFLAWRIWAQVSYAHGSIPFRRRLREADPTPGGRTPH